MLPGPTIIRRCSECSHLIEQQTISSGNTFGARFWTDGRMEAPMLPDTPWLVKCWHCNALIWVDEQEQVGEVEPFGPTGGTFPDARPHESPSFGDYLTIIERGMLDATKERYVRVRAWWAGNDERRYGHATSSLSPQETANLRALAMLLDESEDDDRIMKAEAMRELGEFGSCVALLAESFSPDQARAAAIIRDLATKNTALVTEMALD